MPILFRNFTNEPGFSADFHRVRDFLVRINRKNPIRYGFEWGRWEWAFSLPYLDTTHLSKIGVWEKDATIVGLVTYETEPGTAYFCLDQDFDFLKKEMLVYARDNLGDKEGNLKILISNTDRTFQRAAAGCGFKPTQDGEAWSVYDIDVDRIEYTISPGYSILSLAEDCDLMKYNKVLWRGFNHEGEPPTTAEQIEIERISLSGPHLNPALNVVAVSPDGDYASYCGMWYDEKTEYALVEPVATDPAYRRLGLGKAVVLEGIRRCGKLGAKQAYVGSSQQFYYQLGFHPLPGGTFWEIR
ncbi:MAG: GNAT family N-acetyltransferase [Anaerolineales bacterium]|nr:GNAT family N-acetyltransferase [Anaerolineales bacterium]